MPPRKTADTPEAPTRVPIPWRGPVDPATPLPTPIRRVATPDAPQAPSVPRRSKEDMDADTEDTNE